LFRKAGPPLCGAKSAARSDLSGNLLVQLGVVTEDLNQRWYEANTGQVITDIQRRTRACGPDSNAQYRVVVHINAAGARLRVLKYGARIQRRATDRPPAQSRGKVRIALFDDPLSARKTCAERRSRGVPGAEIHFLRMSVRFGWVSHRPCLPGAREGTGANIRSCGRAFGCTRAAKALDLTIPVPYGLLMSYGPNLPDYFRKAAAAYVNMILHGARLRICRSSIRPGLRK
jgi:hypothetical protein